MASVVVDVRQPWISEVVAEFLEAASGVSWDHPACPNVTLEEAPFIDYTYYPSDPDSYRVPSLVNHRHIDTIIIHTLEGSALTPLENYTRPDDRRVDRAYRGTGTHFVVGRDGRIYASTPIRYAAITERAQTGYRFRSINIECEGRHDDPATFGGLGGDDRLWKSLVKLVRWLCQQYGIPRTRMLPPNGPGLFGHSDIDPPPHRYDPGPYFRWDAFLASVNTATPTQVVFPEGLTPETATDWTLSEEVPVRWLPVVMCDYDSPGHQVTGWYVIVYYFGTHLETIEYALNRVFAAQDTVIGFPASRQGIYQILVSAQNQYGPGEWSNPRWVYQHWQPSTSPPPPPPVPPSAVTFTLQQTNPHLVVEWAPLTNQGVLEYEYGESVYNPLYGWLQVPPFGPATYSIPANRTRLDGSWSDNLSPWEPGDLEDPIHGWWYKVSVRARNAAGYGPWNEWVFWYP